MKRRPYLTLDISRLSKLVNAKTQDKVLLEAVLFELQFRKLAQPNNLNAGLSSSWVRLITVQKSLRACLLHELF